MPAEAVTLTTRYVDSRDWPASELAVLRRASALCGASWLERHHSAHLAHLAGHLAPGGGCAAALLQRAVEELSRRLAADSVALADALAPPDFVLNSALGHSSGRIYENLRADFFAEPGAFARADFWPEVVQHIKSKL